MVRLVQITGTIIIAGLGGMLALYLGATAVVEFVSHADHSVYYASFFSLLTLAVIFCTAGAVSEMWLA